MSKEKQKKEIKNQKRFVETWLSDLNSLVGFLKKRKKQKQDAQFVIKP